MTRIQANQTKKRGIYLLHDLLRELYEQEGLESHILKENETQHPGVLYLLAKDIENAFDDRAQQISPLSLFITSPRALDLLRVINAQGKFLSELRQWDPFTQTACLLLIPHPLLK